MLFNLLEISPEQGRVDLTYFSVHTRISGARWEEEIKREKEKRVGTTGVKKGERGLFLHVVSFPRERERGGGFV